MVYWLGLQRALNKPLDYYSFARLYVEIGLIRLRPVPVSRPIARTMMQTVPTPLNARRRDAGKYKDMAVQFEYTTPESFQACSAFEALAKAWPQDFKTETAAKKACRCVNYIIEHHVGKSYP
jgi:hypothetical protein